MLTNKLLINIASFFTGISACSLLLANPSLALVATAGAFGVLFFHHARNRGIFANERQAQKTLADFYKECKKRRYQNIGYPTSEDFHSEQIKDFLDLCINNCGNWSEGSNFPIKTFRFEKEVIQYFAEKFGTNLEESWGYVTTGGTEGNIWSCYLAREKFPNGILYYSDSAHYSITKIVRLLKIPACVVNTDEKGEMDYGDLKQKIAKNNHANPIIFFNIGSTMTGAIDDINQIKSTLEALGFSKEQYYLHADAAFSGMILPFVKNAKPFKFSDGIDSIAVSGHKMIGSPIPCGIALARKALVETITTKIEVVNITDATITGSRNGIACLHLWYEIKRTSEDDKKQRIHACLATAKQTVEKLNALGVPAWKNKHSVTVVFPSPKKEIWQKYHLATAQGLSHIIITGYTGQNQRYLQQAISEIAKDYSIPSARE